MKPKIILLFFTYYLLLTTAIGCDAFRKKFIRKPKAQKEVRVVVETKRYESTLSQKQVYVRYFAFWQAWHEELVDTLDMQEVNRKRRTAAGRGIVENLKQMRRLLMPEKQKQLDLYILVQEDIMRQLEEYRISHAKSLRIKSMLKKQKREIKGKFHYKNIEAYLIKDDS